VEPPAESYTVHNFLQTVPAEYGRLLLAGGCMGLGAIKKVDQLHTKLQSTAAKLEMRVF